MLSQIRIDYFLLSSSLVQHVQNVYYNDTCFSDHCFVNLRLDLESDIEKRPGMWILNNLFLTENEYTFKIKRIIAESKTDDLYKAYPLIWWDHLKYKIKRASQLYGKARNKATKTEYYRLHNKLQDLSAAIASHNTIIDIEKYKAVQAELEKYEMEKCKGAIFRSKATWAI